MRVRYGYLLGFQGGMCTFYKILVCELADWVGLCCQPRALLADAALSISVILLILNIIYRQMLIETFHQQTTRQRLLKSETARQFNSLFRLRTKKSCTIRITDYWLFVRGSHQWQNVPSEKRVMWKTLPCRDAIITWVIDSTSKMSNFSDVCVLIDLLNGQLPDWY